MTEKITIWAEEADEDMRMEFQCEMEEGKIPLEDGYSPNEVDIVFPTQK